MTASSPSTTPLCEWPRQSGDLIACSILGAAPGKPHVTPRAAETGRAHGIDLSHTMLEIARRRNAEEGLLNATFEVADAQNHAFAEAEFDLCIRRFGVMFFANVANAVRPGGRFVFVVWQGRDRNEWATA